MFPDAEEALLKWVETCQDNVGMNGDIIKEKDAEIMNKMHPVEAAFQFSEGWLLGFKKRCGIKSYLRSGDTTTTSDR
ncbi:hypothetical protein BGX26_006998 [Mortierella sp. AD094]|nr:hypothetical protein BGX26_006998 [Mortierella sp. AD094]